MRRCLLTTASLALAVLLTGCSAPGGTPATGSPGSAFGSSSGPATAAPASSTTASAPAAEPTASAPSAEPTPEATSTGRDLDSAASPTVVVNKARPLNPVDYAPASLEEVGGVRLRAEAAQALAALRADAAAAGHDLTVLSGYRSHQRQREVYAGWVDHHGSTEAADRVSARPGHSEHQTGLAVDVGDAAAPDCDLAACFGQTGAGRWVAEHAHEHGFVVRYPAGAEPVTGFSAEPWHLRWLGPEAAAEVRMAGGVVETAFRLPAAPNYPG